jgi:hypothetical protein
VKEKGEGEGEGEGGGEFPVAAATAGDEPPPAPVNTSINPTTFIFAFGGVSGVEPGTIPELPVLPFVPAPGVFTFDAPTPQRWFDPPSVDGFTYRLESGTFIAVGTPPESFGFDSVMLYIDGVAVERTGSGRNLRFPAGRLHGHHDVRSARHLASGGSDQSGRFPDLSRLHARRDRSEHDGDCRGSRAGTVGPDDVRSAVHRCGLAPHRLGERAALSPA